MLIYFRYIINKYVNINRQHTFLSLGQQNKLAGDIYATSLMIYFTINRIT